MEQFFSFDRIRSFLIKHYPDDRLKSPPHRLIVIFSVSKIYVEIKALLSTSAKSITQ